MKDIYNNGKSSKIIAEMEVVNIREFIGDSYSYYDSGLRRLYVFKDEDEQEYIYWTSKNFLVKGHFEDIEKNGNIYNDWIIDSAVNIGGKIVLKGFIKGEKEYNGRHQIQLTRCNVLEVIDEGPSPEERLEMRKSEQKNSISIQDKVIKITYKEYKENYSECETIIDSFERTSNGCFIEVIIRG